MQFVDLQAQRARIKGLLDTRIQSVLDHGQFILGPEVGELESALVEFSGSGHCVAAASGTDALLLALMALGVGPGDEVITTPFSFIATVETILLLGATPVFVDIDPVSYNIDHSHIGHAFSDRTKAIIAVSLYGQCASFREINAIAAKAEIPVIEDAAQSFGARYGNQRSCAVTEIACTSFFPSKPLGCYGDGGACFTADESLAQVIRELSTHGQTERYLHSRVGVNARMDTLQATVLLAKLTLYEEEIGLRQAVASRYTSLLEAKCPQVITPVVIEGRDSVFAQYSIQIEEREKVRGHLAECGIPTAVHYPIPLHRQPVLTESRNFRAPGALDVAETVARKILSLPMHAYLDVADQEHIVDELATALE